MAEELSNKKRIAKNTLLLYLRMFVTMAVGLYTSRLVLQTLGVVDYGIYNVVGGIIATLAFLNHAMVAATQRYISYELGRGDHERLMLVFITSVNIHVLIAIVAIVLGETIGLWFINTKLIIPTDRLIAANWVYQASIVTFVLSIVSVPYNASIVAHEKMSSFAYISIVESVLKLVIVYILLLTVYDKLIVYSVLLSLVAVLVFFCYWFYCYKCFEECKYRFVRDKILFKEMTAFAGWSVLGNMGLSFRDQFSNIILNLFFGPTLNAARGLSSHVSSIINTFAMNLTMALHPQITKQYASGNLRESRNLVYTGSRFSFYLLTIVTIPLIINVNYVLELWLGEVPEYTGQFVVLSLITVLIYSLSECVITAIQATGRIKWFQIGISIIMLSELPVAWLLMKLGMPPYGVMWPSIGTYSIALFFRFYLIQRYVEGYSLMDYSKQVLLPCGVIFVVSYFVSAYACHWLETSFLGLLISVLICVSISLSLIMSLGVKRNERHYIFQYAKNKLLKNK